jgi:hypothetical protein
MVATFVRRRIKILIAAVFAASLTTFAVFTSSRKDDLDWIRRYGPTEKVLPGSRGSFGRETFSTTWHYFDFQNLPSGFLDELKRRTDYHKEGDSYHFNGTFPDTDRIMLSKDGKRVEVWMHHKESWVSQKEQQFRGLICLR